MKNFYFTFGIGQPLQNFYQPIVAEDMNQAREKMFKEWGNNWGFAYSEEEFSQAMKGGYLTELRPLEPIYAVTMMTVGEMRSWTERFNQIIGASQISVAERLGFLKDDLKRAYQNDRFANQLINTIEEVI